MRAGLAALVMLIAGDAAAQGLVIPSVSADPNILRNCIEGGKAVETCLGAMTLDCLAENDLPSPALTERLCLVAERNVWLDLIGSTEAQLMGQLQDLPDDPVLGGASAALQDESREWAEWAEANCRLERLRVGQSPRRGIIEDTCARDLAAKRYSALEAIGK